MACFQDCEILNHGVRQGTVLGPLICLFYVNNFSSIKFKTEKVIQLTYWQWHKYCLLCKKVAYIEKLSNFAESRRVCWDEQTDFEYKKRMNIFLLKNSDLWSICFKNEVRAAKLDLKNLVHAVRSIYPIRPQILLKARILFLKSIVFSHWLFSAVFFQIYLRN